MARNFIIPALVAVTGVWADSSCSSEAVAGAALLQVKQEAASKPFNYGDQSTWAASAPTCASGQQQSPINIVSKDVAKGSSGVSLAENYGWKGPGVEHDYELTNNGHSLEVEGTFGTVTVGDTKFTSKQFHFHAPSEHTFNGEHAAMEMHIVNAPPAGYGGPYTTGAVVGLLFDVGEENACLKEVLEQGEPEPDGTRSVGDVDLRCFSEQFNSPWWTYDGSLTTPPCTEGVAWNIMTARATVSQEQLDAFRAKYPTPPGNDREAQPLNGRVVRLNTPF
jgi:carbonic anhydrase